MRKTDAMVCEAVKDPKKQEAFIARYKPFIIRCASAFANRYITESDDEFSVALQAFAQAMESYSYDKGSFLHFAELIIRRRLADFAKANKKYSREIAMDPGVFSGEAEQEGEDASALAEARDKIVYLPDSALKDEIEAANAVLRSYGFSFFDLTECSPKSKKTKKACANAIVFMCKSPALLSAMRSCRQLPAKEIEKNALVPRKILERHRKYIIAAIEILSGEYPCIWEYLKPIREELFK